jgi:hypothetical protein
MYNVDEPKTKEKEKVKKRSDFSSEREWLIYQKERLQKKITKIENQKSKVVTQQKIIVGSVLIDYAKKNKDFADRVLEILNEKLDDKDKKRLATVIDSLKNPVVDDDEAVDDVEHGKDEKQQENPVVVDDDEAVDEVNNDEAVEAVDDVDDVEHGKDDKQKENPVVVVPTEQQQKENPVVVGVQSEPPLTKFFNNAMTNV